MSVESRAIAGFCYPEQSEEPPKSFALLRMTTNRIVGWLTFGWLLIIYQLPLLAETPAIPKLQRIACPADITRLTSLMLRDLPSYTNRYIQSARRLNREFDFYSYTIIASEAELTSLPLGVGEYHSTEPAITSEQPQQVFFTTLERQYHDGKVSRLQEYHWLFLVQTTSGWQLVTMFSSIGDYPSHNPPTPPRESSKGATGQAVITWLRDCQAGSILDTIPVKD